MKSDKWPRIFGFLYFGYIFITMVFEPIIRLSDVAFIVDVFIGFPLLIIGGIYMFVATTVRRNLAITKVDHHLGLD